MLIRNIIVVGDKIFDKEAKVTVYNGVPTDLIIRGGGQIRRGLHWKTKCK